MACACDQIVMGRHSSLGPIDPQIGGMAAHGVIEEFNRARAEITKTPGLIPVWQPILAKYPPTLVGECKKSIDWTNALVQGWLETGMFRRRKPKTADANRVVDELADHALTLSHARHISADRARNIGLRVASLPLVSTSHATVRSSVPTSKCATDGTVTVSGLQVSKPGTALPAAHTASHPGQRSPSLAGLAR